MSGESLRNTGPRSRLYLGSLLGMVVAVLLLGYGLGALPAEASVPSTAIRYFYTPNNRLSAVIKPEAEYAFYTWDAAGNLSSIARKSSTKLSIIQLEPTKGAVGETVDIWGTGFSTTPANDTVKFNGTAATVSAATADMLAVKVPSGATTGTVTVQTTTEGPVTSAQSFTVSSSATGAPTITSLSASAVVAGTTVTITGTNFETNTAYDYVSVNQTAAEVTSATSTSIKFVVPEATSSGKVSVSTPHGEVTGPYLYIPPSGYTTTQIGPTTALTLNSASALTVSSAKTVGVATIEATGGEMMSVVLKNITISSSVAYVYGPHNEEIGHKLFASGEEQLIEPILLPGSGTYTVLIAPGENTGKIEVTPYYADTVTGTLTPTAEGSSKSVALTTPGQKAMFRVSGTPGEEVSVKISEFSSFSKPAWLEWFNVNEELKQMSYTGNGFMSVTTLPATGTYDLAVNPNGINTGSLKLTAYNATAVTGSTTPTSGGESKTITTSVPGQSANITFSGTAGEEISLVLSESTFKYGDISLLTPEGSSLSGASMGFGTSTTMDEPSNALILPTTGTYTIHISASEAETGSVKLTAYKANQVTWSSPGSVDTVDYAAIASG
jgi:hypothetical protein